MMSEAPERIWAFMPDIFDNISIWQDQPSPALDTTEYIRADLASPKVKPLEWVNLSEPHNNWYYADASFGRYRITQVFFPESCFIAVTPTELRISENTLEDAKAAAQEDYERRILAALEMPE